MKGTGAPPNTSGSHPSSLIYFRLEGKLGRASHRRVHTALWSLGLPSLACVKDN